MSISLTNSVSARRFALFTWQKAVQDPRCDSLRPQHHSHGSSKVFAVPRLHIEKKVSQRIATRRLQLQRVPVVLAQVRFNRLGAIITVPSFGTLNYSGGEYCDA